MQRKVTEIYDDVVKLLREAAKTSAPLENFLYCEHALPADLRQAFMRGVVTVRTGLNNPVASDFRELHDVVPK